MNSNLIIKHSQLVTAKFTSAPAIGKRVNFEDIPNLSRLNIVLYGFTAYSDTQLSNGPDGSPVIPAANSNQVLVTLKNIDNEEFVYQYPYFDLIRQNAGGFYPLLQPQIINLTDCYVSLVAIAGISLNDVAVFNFFYDFA